MSLSIGEHISKALSSDAVMVSKFNDRVYPVIIPEGVPKYPYIVYGGLSIHPDYTKDGAGQDDAQMQVAVVAKKYGEVIELSNHVRYQLEGVRAEYDGFTVNDCRVVSISVEYFQEIDAYAVNIMFNFKTNDK